MSGLAIAFVVALGHLAAAAHGSSQSVATAQESTYAPQPRPSGTARVADVEAARRLPFAASIESVLERGSINGQPVSIVRFGTRLRPESVIAAAAREWSKTGRDPVVNLQADGWRIASTYSAGQFLTLQVRSAAGGGSEGLFGVWAPNAHTDATGFDVARLLPTGATVLLRVEGIDGERRHRTIVAIVDGSPGWNAGALESRAASHGFARDPIEGASARGASGESRIYRGAGRELAVTLHPNPRGTAIVAHLIEQAR